MQHPKKEFMCFLGVLSLVAKFWIFFKAPFVWLINRTFSAKKQCFFPQQISDSIFQQSEHGLLALFSSHAKTLRPITSDI
jgi:ABC-type uncharacterized transport system permease subunit